MNTIYNKLTVIQSELISGEKVDRQDVLTKFYPFRISKKSWTHIDFDS